MCHLIVDHIFCFFLLSSFFLSFFLFFFLSLFLSFFLSLFTFFLSFFFSLSFFLSFFFVCLSVSCSCTLSNKVLLSCICFSFFFSFPFCSSFFLSVCLSFLPSLFLPAPPHINTMTTIIFCPLYGPDLESLLPRRSSRLDSPSVKPH